MKNDSLTKFASKIADARPKGRWVVLNRILFQLESNPDLSLPEGVGAWSDALFVALLSHLPSLTRSYFDKMLAAAAFLRKISDASDDSFSLDRFERRSVAAIDIARRLYEIDSDAALKLVEQVRDGNAGVAEAEAALTAAKSVERRTTTLARDHAWEKTYLAEDVLRKKYMQVPEAFLGGGVLKAGPLLAASRSRRFGVSCDFCAQVPEGMMAGTYVGFEILVISQGRERLGWHRRLGQFALSASFFTLYWIVLVVELKASDFVKGLAADLEDLQLSNIGLLVVEDGELVHLREPKNLSPLPDRRDLFSSAMIIK